MHVVIDGLQAFPNEILPGVFLWSENNDITFLGIQQQDDYGAIYNQDDQSSKLFIDLTQEGCDRERNQEVDGSD